MTEALTPEVARVIANLRLDPESEAEVQRLREKANEGTLTIAEEASYKEFIEAVDMISIIQSKARRFLAHHRFVD